jgi:hypothetical protein
MTSNPPKSESPDEFLKENNIKGYDETLTEHQPKSTIAKDAIPSLRQPKEATDCKDCR